MVVIWKLNEFNLQVEIMKKLIIQVITITVVFLLMWFTLIQFDWINIFKVRKITNKTEEKLGNLYWEHFRKTDEENQNPFVINSIDSIVTKICSANNIDREYIKVRILEKDDINAFALPNGYLIIYSGLILNSESPEELSGVICHEIAHIQLNHVTKKLIKEVGLSVLLSITTGNGGTEKIGQTAKLLSSSAFDRSLEKEADIKAVDYLIKADINPESFANFLYKLSDKENEDIKFLSWISTHPDSKERAEYIIEYSNGINQTIDKVITLETWNRIKKELEKSFVKSD